MDEIEITERLNNPRKKINNLVSLVMTEYWTWYFCQCFLRHILLKCLKDTSIIVTSFKSTDKQDFIYLKYSYNYKTQRVLKML